MQQYFVDQLLLPQQRLLLSEEIQHHLGTVLRVRNGASFRLIDASGNAFLCTAELEKKRVFARVAEPIIERREPSLRLTLAMASIRRERWEYALQKTTELGVTRIVPVRTEHTVWRERGDREHIRLRQERILREAAEQSERHTIPRLERELSFDALEQCRSEWNFICYARSGQTTPSLLEACRERRRSEGVPQSVTVLIGPEGGFTENEVVLAEKNGFCCVSLGPLILRAETAAGFAVGLIHAALAE